MKRILFTTDFDVDAPEAFKYTVLLASKLGAKITMFHAFFNNGEIATKEELNTKGADTIEKLKNFVTVHLPKRYNSLKFEYLVDEELPDLAISKVAIEENIDVVVMSMKHVGYSFEELFGNTTLDTMLSIDCGMLIIPEGFQTNEFLKIGCTTDFKFKDIALLNLLRKYAKRFHQQTEIFCLHVFEERSENKERVKKDLKVLKSIFKNKKKAPIHFELHKDKVAKAIESFAIDHELDLMVMNSHQYDFIERWLGKSTTREVARDIQVPLLILKNL